MPSLALSDKKKEEKKMKKKIDLETTTPEQQDSKKKGKKLKLSDSDGEESDKKEKEKKKSKKKRKSSEVDEESEEEKKSSKKVKVDNPNAVSNFRISDPLKGKLKEKGIEALFPIQATTFDMVLDGADLVGRARTGQVKFESFDYFLAESLIIYTIY